MRNVENVRVLDVVWSGPLSHGDACDAKGAGDYGVYQIYGTHSVFGPDSLLYIGLAEQRPFGARLHEHKGMADWESACVQIYFGRLGGMGAIPSSKFDEWGEMIKRVEDLLIYFCAPPYNSRQITNLRKFEPTAVLNFGRHHRLPYMVSNLWDMSPVGDGRFEVFTE